MSWRYDLDDFEYKQYLKRLNIANLIDNIPNGYTLIGDVKTNEIVCYRINPMLEVSRVDQYTMDDNPQLAWKKLFGFLDKEPPLKSDVLIV